MDEDQIAVRLDGRGFAADVAAMRATLEGSLGDAAEVAGRRIEGALLRAVRTGKFGFDDLRRVALSALGEIARQSLQAGVAHAGGGGGGGLLGLATALLGGLGGAPGRATGGPVGPGQAYLVGERGPELFVPTTSGRMEAGGGRGRDIRITVNVAGGPGDPARMAASGRQIAQAVRRALEQSD